MSAGPRGCEYHMIYTHGLQQGPFGVKSPLDRL